MGGGRIASAVPINNCSDDSHSKANYKTHVPYVSEIHNSVHDLFNVCSNHALLNYSGQGSKNSLQTCDLEIRSRSSNLV